MYGSNGFLQYQFVVPFEESDVVRTAVEQVSDTRIPSFLSVLKYFGPANPAPMSFPREGWTLTVDAPIGNPELPASTSGARCVTAWTPTGCCAPTSRADSAS
jgi:decaprenylphospho-beta-D-ribofuranose 2-oxidase